MSKTLYEEALADAKQLKEIAESNAKRAIIEAVTPKIRDLIERQLLGESDDESDDEVLTDDIHELDGASGAIGVDPAPADGGGASKTSTPVDESDDGMDGMVAYEVAEGSVSALLPLVKGVSDDKVEVNVYRIAETTNDIVTAVADVRASGDYITKIDETIRQIEDMYQYLQESGDSLRKSKLESKLEKCFEILNAVKETTMSMKDLVSEDKEVTLKLTGLPDDVELDNLNIDLISDEEETGEELPGGDELAVGDEVPGGEEPLPSEGLDMMGELDEDEVVEISESMLKTEIARMRAKMTEGNLKPEDGGNKPGSDEFDDFGGGKDEGEAFLDGDVTTAETQSVNETDGDDDEDDKKVDETDIQGKMDDDHVAESDVYEAAVVTFETLKKIYESSKGQSKKAAKHLALEAQRKMVSAKVALAEAKKISKKTSNKSSKQLSESKAVVESLRKQLTEVNLLNAKLIHANKLLQNEGLSPKQKSIIIDKLDEAQNLREVKLVYESLVRALTDKKTVKEGTEGRKILAGSSSRTTRTASAPATLTEGNDIARWAKLAGISK